MFVLKGAVCWHTRGNQVCMCVGGAAGSRKERRHTHTARRASEQKKRRKKKERITHTHSHAPYEKKNGKKFTAARRCLLQFVSGEILNAFFPLI